MKQVIDPNQFLYAISAIDKLKVEDYLEVFSSICVEKNPNVEKEFDLKNEAYRYLRVMKNLGHVENDGFGQNNWVYCCPPVLAQVHSRPLWAVLCGARGEELISDLKKYVKKSKVTNMVITKQDYHLREGEHRYLFPDAIFIKSNKEAALERLSDKMGIQYSGKTPLGQKIAEFSGSIEEYESSLQWDKHKTEDPFGARERGYSPDKLYFHWTEKVMSPLIEYRFRKWDYQTWFWDGDRAARVDRAWGRYMALKKAKKDILIYSREGQWLAVPSLSPLPALLERAATLSSGLVPYKTTSGDVSKYKLPPNTDFDIFFRVPPQTAEIIAEKTGQRLREVKTYPGITPILL